MNDVVTIEHGSLDLLLRALHKEGFSTIAPTVRDGTIVLEEIITQADLPSGVTDEQEAGRYRLKSRSDDSRFGYAAGPHSWKRYLFPSEQKLFAARRGKGGFEIADTPEPNDGRRYAYVGVRPCELAAISVLDNVLLGGEMVDARYRTAREGIFIVAVNCTHPGGTCFCASMGTGPRAGAGFDLALTEIVRKQSSFLLVEAGSERGAKLLERIPHRNSTQEERAAAEKALAQAEKNMGRTVKTKELAKKLSDAGEHPEWARVAARCLTCTNCTMVCPTCFCTTVDDVTDLTGAVAERWRKWDSCFTMDFSYIHGGSVRSSSSARYRQWLTHKFSSWQQQFGTFGCVGCGRCITWCPVGIDITEELRRVTGGEQPSTRKDNGHGNS
jgi:ferredoxin